MANNTSKRGFASMNADKQRAIASKGGKASGGQFKSGDERTKRAAKKGGESG